VGIKQEILWSKQIAKTYYGRCPAYNYWNGCSTGGRQGYLLAQELGNELDGILANAPAMYWTRFQTAQMWGQIAMFELAGETPPGAIEPNKVLAVQRQPSPLAMETTASRTESSMIPEPVTLTQAPTSAADLTRPLRRIV
jgi:Tannase and feruloyl esterase